MEGKGVFRRLAICQLQLMVVLLFNSARCDDEIPEPVGLFPLNSLHKTEDISNSYLTAGVAVNVALAPGPYGKPGGSYYFPGTASSYIDIPKQSKLDTRYSISIFAWIYNEGPPGPIINYCTQTNQFAFHVYINDHHGGPDDLFVRVMRRSTLAENDYMNYNLKTTKKWRHIGFTYDINTGNQRLYVDGIKVRESFIAKQEIATDYKVRIGGAKVGDSRYFKGRISCVQFYDKALTPKQVLAIMNRCQERDDAEKLYQAAIFQSTDGQCLLNHVMHSENNMADVFICIQHCLKFGEKCKSINFMDNNGTCHLNNATESDYPKHKIMEAYCTYFQRIAVASSRIKVSD